MAEVPAWRRGGVAPVVATSSITIYSLFAAASSLVCTASACLCTFFKRCGRSRLGAGV